MSVLGINNSLYKHVSTGHELCLCWSQVNGTPLLDTEMTAEVLFLNPLLWPLKNCSVTLTGSGLLKQTEQSK